MGELVNHSDDEVVRAIQSGKKSEEERVLKSLYKAHFPLIRSIILKNNGQEFDVADIFQESLIALYNQIKENKFRNDASVKGYIYAIARNIWLKKLKKKNTDAHEMKELYTVEANFDDKDQSSLHDARAELVRDLIDKMGEGCKEILIDFYYKDFSMKDIMKKFDLGSEQAARNKKYRCMQILIKKIRQMNLSLDYDKS